MLTLVLFPLESCAFDFSVDGQFPIACVEQEHLIAGFMVLHTLLKQFSCSCYASAQGRALLHVSALKERIAIPMLKVSKKKYHFKRVEVLLCFCALPSGMGSTRDEIPKLSFVAIRHPD